MHSGAAMFTRPPWLTAEGLLAADRRWQCHATAGDRTADGQELTEDNIEDFVSRVIPQDAWVQDDSDWAADMQPKVRAARTLLLF